MDRFEHAPIERHEALAPFSRDHYIGLVQAQRLKKAADAGDVARRKAVAEFMDAWDAQIDAHFADEERLLANLAEKGDGQRLLAEHRQLRELVAQARELRHQADPAADMVRQIGEKLEQHIRWEERELFVRLQDQLSQSQLATLEHQTRQIEQARPRNICRSNDGESEAIS